MTRIDYLFVRKWAVNPITNTSMASSTVAVMGPIIVTVPASHKDLRKEQNWTKLYTYLPLQHAISAKCMGVHSSIIDNGQNETYHNIK